MRLVDGQFSASPTDLANFLACRHKSHLDLLVAQGRLAKPMWADPLADVLRERGVEHEKRYIEQLRAKGLVIVDLREAPREDRSARTLRAMHAGADVIVQAALENACWLGYSGARRPLSRLRTPSLVQPRPARPAQRR